MGATSDSFYEKLIKEIEHSEKVMNGMFSLAKKGTTIDSGVIKEKGGTKDNLATTIIEFMERTHSCVKLMKMACREIDNCKSETKESIIEVTKLQKELIKCKDEQIDNFKSSVQSTLKTEFKSYSEAVAKSSGESLTVRNIRTVVKDAVRNVTDGFERTKNVIIFGLKEETGENVVGKVRNVFLAIDQKPKIEASRFGKDNDCRPVRVTLNGVSVVSDILKAAKKLKTTEQYSGVYICPDRSEEQRKEHKKLVNSLKKKIQDFPGQHFYIKGGKVCGDETGSSKSKEPAEKTNDKVTVLHTSQTESQKQEQKTIQQIPSFVRYRKGMHPRPIPKVFSSCSDSDV